MQILENVKKSALEKANETQSDNIELTSILIVSNTGEAIDSISSGDSLNIRIKFKINKLINKPEIVIGTHTTDFVYLTASSTDTDDFPLDKLEEGEYCMNFEHKHYPLKPGTYGVRIAIFDQNRNGLYAAENLIFFSVNKTALESKEPPLKLLNIPSTFYIKKHTG